MSDLPKRLSQLSPGEKRALLAELLRKGGRKPRSSYPLGYTQQGIWFLYQLAPEMAAYTISVAAHIRSAIDVAALRQAFQALIDRHPALRTTFTVRNGKPIQEVHDHAPLRFEETDASTWSPAELKERLVQEAHRPFDLERGPVLGVTLFRRSAGDHVLLVAVHHIAIDFWSFVVLMDDLSILYPAQATGLAPSLPPLPMHYADYLAWQADMLAGPEGERLWSYWRRQLAGELPVLDLPTDRPRPPVQTFAGASHAFRLDEELTGRLKALAKAEGATLYMTFLAAFQVLLHRYTGQEDILVASPLAARTRAEFEGIVGCVTNPVMLRGDLSGNPAFKAFLAQTRRTVLEALEHQDFPALLLVERLKPPRDPSRPRLYQVMFNMVRTHRLEGEALAQFALGETGFRTNVGGLDLESFHLEYRVAVLDLEMTIGEVSGGISAHVVYNTDLFDAATIARLERHFRILLEGIVADPDRRVGEFPLVSEPERHRLLVEWNETGADYPSESCVHELFEAQARRTPDAPAVVFEGQRLTYAELDRRANQLAHSLRALGVGPDALVGICVERSLEMVVGLLGILKAGGAYVPLDPTYPSARLAVMLADAEVRVLVTQEGLVQRLPPHGATVVRLDTGWKSIAQEPEDAPVTGATAATLAYVIYTSGSSGRPKGVLVPHRAVVNHSVAVAKRFGLGPSDRILQFASISFDAAVEELIPSWLSGATVVLRPEGAAPSGPELLRLIEREQVTVLNLPTAYWHEWVYELDLSGERLPPSLRLVVVGGEKASPERYATWQKVSAGGMRWMNTYGPTEATVTATVYEPPSPGTPDLASELPIGRPIANSTIYLLDAHGQLVPIGVPGELYIGGPGVARGYLNRPELTAEKFVPDPFGGDAGARLFRTGDLARYRPDGNIEYVGRTDHQVKIRGFRIELEEIEAVLGQHPGVRETIVVACEDASGEKRLVGYLVAGPSAPPSSGELRTFLKEHLPEYMVPSAFVFLSALPLTLTGKVDHRALPPPDWARPVRKGTFVAPRNSLEEGLAGIWADVLGLDRVGVHDDFFELGGHSLMTIQLMARLRDTFRVELPLRSLFEAPTVAGLADRIEAARQAGAGFPAIPLRSASEKQDLDSPAAEHRQPASRPWSPLVAIQRGGSGPAFFCVHPVGGSVVCYVDLARHLGPDQPCYGLQAPLDGERDPFTDLADMAARYIEAIREVQSRGPYFLGGWSFGGIVAYEMARQLERRGHRVGVVALLDSWAPGFGMTSRELDAAAMVALFARDLGGLAGKRLPISADDLRRLGADDQLKIVREQALRANILPPETGLLQLGQLLRVWTANMRAALSSEPGRSSSRVALFRASAGVPEASAEGLPELLSDPTLGWGRLVSQRLETYAVPGDHYTMLARPHVQVLAEQLRRCLAQVRAGNDGL
ncbi:MAG: amino acid adenylation domain-containing protein [Candidatus Rokubacteria bacterium]|nr:amino acid adenylation domain-containing protein [Candidatus Rokubacteria bacterium]